MFIFLFFGARHYLTPISPPAHIGPFTIHYYTLSMTNEHVPARVY